MRSPLLHATLGLAGLCLIAALQAWPLPVRMDTHLTGAPSGDGGVYVWNTWVFREELVNHGAPPLRTSAILPLDGPTNLGLHNYTLFADLLAVPLQPWLGVVGAFNLIYLINVALAGWGAFLLARRTCGRTAEAWLAGVLFACSPFLVARSAAHFSLVAAAPLPFFMYWLDRAWTSARRRDAIAVGACFGWAAACDPYYAVYCLMLGACLAACKTITITTDRTPAAHLKTVRRLVDGSLVAIAAAVLLVHVIADGRLKLGSVVLSMRTIYTPMLLFTTLAVMRVLITHHHHVAWTLPRLRPLLRNATAAAIVAIVLLSPVLYAVGRGVLDGHLGRAPVPWRSSAAGADLLAFAIPNPAHPLAPIAWHDWIESRPNGYVDNVVSLSWVAVLVIALACWRTGYRPRRFWLYLTIGFGVLALGPFVQIAGINTNIPTPWALLRYVPLIEAARMPSRFAVIVTLGLAMMFAGALVAFGRHRPRHRAALLAGIGTLLAFELLPVPRTLYSAEVPAIYATIAADPRPVRVLELPFGIRDGLSSMGDFTAESQFYQTMHGKPLIGGYLSRVSPRTKSFHRRMPVLDALLTLSEGRSLTPHQRAHAVNAADDFVGRSDLGYVVIRTSRVSPDLRELTMILFRLESAGTSGDYELYVVR